MLRIKPRLKVFLVLLAGAATLGIASGGAPLVALAKAGVDQFGYTPVRSGTPAGAARFTLTSPDLQDHHSFSLSEVANVFGCQGGNQAPRLEWSGAPSGTKSFVVTMFDPDAPTGSGFWHWLVWDIPAGGNPSGSFSLDATALPTGSVSGTNDAGMTGYLGPCPPAGDKTHRYQLTVYALDVSTLGLTADTHAAVVRFSMRDDILGFGQLIGDYSRPPAA
jgi:Raf kinase inhibitor-like YbhB/YbcL family protein